MVIYIIDFLYYIYVQALPDNSQASLNLLKTFPTLSGVAGGQYRSVKHGLYK